MNKIGIADYGMDVWYGGCFHLEMRLELLKSVGADGIEWLKADNAAEAVQHASRFHGMGMDFVSCRSSDPEMSLKLASAFGKEYVWFPMNCGRDVPFDVYCRQANAFVEAAARYGVKGALHNHLGCRVETMAELDAFMNAVPGALLLLDVGHLHAAGGDCVEAVRKYGDRLASVHFKDVFCKDKNIGLERWWDRLCFCELGAGNAGFDGEAVARALRARHYSKWVLLECDTHRTDPGIELKRSVDILKQWFAGKPQR